MVVRERKYVGPAPSMLPSSPLSLARRTACGDVRLLLETEVGRDMSDVVVVEAEVVDRGAPTAMHGGTFSDSTVTMTTRW
jgi:hypothetical protein